MKIDSGREKGRCSLCKRRGGLSSGTHGCSGSSPKHRHCCWCTIMPRCEVPTAAVGVRVPVACGRALCIVAFTVVFFITSAVGLLFHRAASLCAAQPFSSVCSFCFQPKQTHSDSQDHINRQYPWFYTESPYFCPVIAIVSVQRIWQ